MAALGVEAIYAVRWHQEWKQYVPYGGTRSGSSMCRMVTPGMEASFSTAWFVWICAGTTILVSPSQQEGWILKWTQPLTVRPPRHICHQELTGSLWCMQFSFSLDVSSDIYVLLRAWRPYRLLATALSGQSIVYACIWQMMLSSYAHYDGTLHSALELCNANTNMSDYSNN